MLGGYIFITMNNFKKLTSVFLAGLFFLSMQAFSYDSDIQNCINISDPSARLSCYDAIFQKNQSIEEAKTTPKKIEAIKTDKQKKKDFGMEKPATITPKKIEAIKTDEQKKKDFGMEKPKEYTSITAKIVDVNKRGNYKIYITLDNDQVWRSVESIYDRVPVRKGQTDTISEAYISGYIMKVEGKKVSLRVRRAK